MAYPEEEARAGEGDDDPDGVEDCQKMSDGARRRQRRTCKAAELAEEEEDAAEEAERKADDEAAGGGEWVHSGGGCDGPGDEAIEPLGAGEAEEGKGRVALEELRVWDEAARRLEVEPAFGRGHGSVWRCRE